MKIIKNKPFEEIKESSHNHLLKRIGIAGAVLIVFALVYALLYSFTSPMHFSQKNIAQPYAVVESEGGIYFGPLLNMCYEGTGEFRHLNGGVYEGEFSKSKRSGTGTFHFANGDTYSGTWANDQMVEGTYTFADGRTYQGKFSDGKFSSGTFTLGKNAEALGYSDFTADIDNGQVMSLSFQQKDGLHYNGEVNGYAEITYTDGNTYAGEVKNGVRDGKGTFRWMVGGSQAASYVGDWSKGIMSGSGTYYYPVDKKTVVAQSVKSFVVCGDTVIFLDEGSVLKKQVIGEKSASTLMNHVERFYLNGHILAETKNEIIEFKPDGKNRRKVFEAKEPEAVLVGVSGDKLLLQDGDEIYSWMKGTKNVLTATATAKDRFYASLVEDKNHHVYYGITYQKDDSGRTSLKFVKLEGGE